MENPKRYVQSAILIVTLALMGGCQQASGPAARPLTMSGSKTIYSECIVKYFRQDKAPYITEQKHTFIAKTGYLQISSTEPTGRYIFTLNNTQFSSTKEKTPFLSALPASFVNQQLSTGLYYAFCAGAGLLNTEKMQPLEPIKIEGQWYQPLPAGLKSSIQATLLKNMSTHRIDLVEVTRDKDGFTPDKDILYFYRPAKNRWLLKSYNYRYNQELKTLVPMKIDVFNTSGGLASKELVIQLEYKGVQTQ